MTKDRYPAVVNVPIRLGVRGDVALPLRPGERYDHVIEVVDGPTGGVQSEISAGICPAPSCRDRDAGPNRAMDWRALIMTREGQETRVEVLQVSACQHLTQLVVSHRQSVESWPDGVPTISLWDLASLAHSSRAGTERGEISGSLRNALLINLESSLKSGLLNANVQLSSPEASDDPVARLARHRRALTEVHALGLAAQVDSRSLALISGALARADAELQIVIANQMYRLYVSNTRLAEAAREAELRIANRERRWSRLAAATIVPLLFLSLLGTNTLPRRLFGVPVESAWSFLAVTMTTAVLAAIGFAWANHNRGVD